MNLETGERQTLMLHIDKTKPFVVVIVFEHQQRNAAFPVNSQVQKRPRVWRFTGRGAFADKHKFRRIGLHRHPNRPVAIVVTAKRLIVDENATDSHSKELHRLNQNKTPMTSAQVTTEFH